MPTKERYIILRRPEAGVIKEQQLKRTDAKVTIADLPGGGWVTFVSKTSGDYDNRVEIYDARGKQITYWKASHWESDEDMAVAALAAIMAALTDGVSQLKNWDEGALNSSKRKDVDDA